MSEAQAHLQEARPRRFRPYPEYKDSGVEWLGKIPARWDAKKMKRMCLVRRGASPRPIDDPIYFDDEGEFAWVRIADVTASERYLEATTQRLSELGKSKSVALEPGELFVSIAATVGKPIITRIKCCIHDGFVYFVGLRENREYLYYLFSCGEPYKGLGKLGTQLNLNTDTIGDIPLPRPPRTEQEHIVRFLDRETARIDALVAKKERLIELLLEKRSALITRAVTKGLDPDVPMKESGVEWLGEIPAHWEMKPLKYFLRSSLAYGVLKPDKYDGDDGVRLIRILDVESGHVHQDQLELISPQQSAEFERTVVRAGELIVSVVGTIGRAFIVPLSLEGANLSRALARVQLNPALDASLLEYWFSSTPFASFVELIPAGTAQRVLNLGDLAEFVVVAPTEVEQIAIAAFLDRETAKLDALVTKVREAIERLREFRAALISAAVTGKIDVREEPLRELTEAAAAG